MGKQIIVRVTDDAHSTEGNGMITTNESITKHKAKRLARRRASQRFHRSILHRTQVTYQLPNPIRQLLKQKNLTDQEIDAAIKEGEQEFHKGKRNESATTG